MGEVQVKITVEFTGLAREIAKTREIAMHVPDGATYREVMSLVAERYPSLVGLLFNSTDGTLLNSIVLSRNGEEMILPDHMEERPADGDTLMIVGIIVGGT